MSGATQPSPQDPSHAGTDLPRVGALLAFTWNVKGNADSLRIACKHLAQQGTCVACFQEVPAEFDAAEILVWSSNQLKSLTRPVPAPRKGRPEHWSNPGCSSLPAMISVLIPWDRGMSGKIVSTASAGLRALRWHRRPGRTWRFSASMDWTIGIITQRPIVQTGATWPGAFWTHSGVTIVR